MRQWWIEVQNLEQPLQGPRFFRFLADSADLFVVLEIGSSIKEYKKSRILEPPDVFRSRALKMSIRHWYALISCTKKNENKTEIPNN